MTTNDIKYFYKGATFGFQRGEEDFLDRLIYEIRVPLQLWYDVHNNGDAWVPEYRDQGMNLSEIVKGVLKGLDNCNTEKEKIYIIDCAFNLMHSNGPMLERLLDADKDGVKNFPYTDITELKGMLDLLGKVDLPRLWFHGVEASIRGVRKQIAKLVELADSLDSKGMFKEANDIDEGIRYVFWI